MPTIDSAFTDALLAAASYRTFTSSVDLPEALSRSMTDPLAAIVSKNFSVMTQFASGLSSFDATIWRANDSDGMPNPDGKLYLSMRGTQEFGDFIADVDLAFTGGARAQLTDLVNWWLRISTPTNQQAPQILSLSLVHPITVPVPIYIPGFSVPGEGLIRAADLAAGIEVNGHSLGGYLATAFTRLFGAQAHVQHTSTFNGAGFAPGNGLVFAQIENILGTGYGLGRFPNKTEQANYFAMHGMNVTTNSLWFSQQGQRMEVFNENSLVGVRNHYMYKIVDSLALGAALSKLDTGLTTQRLNTLLAAGSNRTESSIEGLFDGIRGILQGSSIEPTPVGDVEDSARSRVRFHETLAALQEQTFFKSLAGNMSIAVPGPNIAAQARARVGFSEIAALEALSPMILAPVNADGRSALEALWQNGAWADKYLQWVSDSAEIQTGAKPDNYTDNWMADRSVLLASIVAHNIKDGSGRAFVSGLPADRAYDLRWVDAAGNNSGLIADSAATKGVVPLQLLAFGGAGDDRFLGSDNLLPDHIYGREGDDVIDGGGGNDYIEGNAGDDRLYGGYGVDTLLGGAGDDDLSGEGGNDLLLGGSGDDIYRFDGAWGKDTISDANDKGTLRVNGKTLVGGKAIGHRDSWADKDSSGNTVNYAVVDDANSSTGKRLVIRQGGDTSNTISINNFSLATAQSGAGYLGIKLDSKQRLILKEGGGPNVWSDQAFDPASFEGKSSFFAEGGGRGYMADLAAAANEGDALTRAAAPTTSPGGGRGPWARPTTQPSLSPKDKRKWPSLSSRRVNWMRICFAP
jgi:uncharacterized protein YodC (DUF2158 family)